MTLRRLPDVRSALRFWTRSAALRAFREDWDALIPVLRAAGAWARRDALRPMREVALAKTVWSELAPSIDCRAVVARTNYRPLSAVALSDQAASGRLTLSFQHSIVTAPASFVPIPSTRFASFGASSQALLERLDAELAERARCPRVCRQVLPVGSLVDEVIPAAPRPEGPVLVIDSGEGFAPRFLGVAEPYEALADVVRALARGGVETVVRVHPRGGARRWRRLTRELSGAARVSAGRPLRDDLAEASLVIGLFSTVLPIAAASGLPTLFLWRPGWYSTPDLAPFAPDHFVSPEDVPARVRELRQSEAAHEAARRRALAAAAEYVAGLKRCEFTPEDVDALLAPISASPRA